MISWVSIILKRVMIDTDSKDSLYAWVKKKCPSTLLCMLASSHRFSKGSSHLNQDHQDQSTQLQKEVYPSCALSLPHVSSKRSSLEFIHVTVFENHFKSLNLHHCARRQLILLRCSQSHPCVKWDIFRWLFGHCVCYKITIFTLYSSLLKNEKMLIRLFSLLLCR